VAATVESFTGQFLRRYYTAKNGQQEALDEEAAEAFLFEDVLAAEHMGKSAAAKDAQYGSRASKGRTKKTGVPDARVSFAAVKTNSATAEAGAASTKASVKRVASKSAAKKPGKA
jgi:hypothetical protein